MSLLSQNIQAFVAIVEQGTVHGAAKSLHLTQTGVTQRIRSLEASLKATLFTRSRKGMQLTQEGEALLRYSKGARELEGEALPFIQGGAIQTEVQIRICGPTSIMRSRLISAFAQALKEFPKLLVAFEVSDAEDRSSQLKNGGAHLCVLPPEHIANEFDSKLLRPERYLLLGPAAWKKRKIQDIVRTERNIDFDPTDKMTLSYLKKFDLLDMAQPGRHFVNNNGALCDLVAAGLGYAVLTEEVARPWIEEGKLIKLNSGKYFENQLALAWYPRPQCAQYLKRLIGLAK